MLCVAHERVKNEVMMGVWVNVEVLTLIVMVNLNLAHIYRYHKCKHMLEKYCGTFNWILIVITLSYKNIKI